MDVNDDHNVSEHDLICGVRNKPNCDYKRLIIDLLNKAKLYSSQPNYMHLVANELKYCTAICREQQIVIDLALQERLLEFCYTFFNYTLEVVNFTCVDIFSDLLHLHFVDCSICVKECCIFMKNIEVGLMNISLVNKCRLKSLLLWLKFNRTTISSVDFIESMYLLLDNTSLVITVYHTKAERKLELELVLTNLCIQHNDYNRAQWNDFISEEHLLKALIHHSEELSFNAWKLLCFHPKATWPVCSTDIYLIKIFLICNMTEQKSSKRQEIFKGLRKILMRIRESARLKTSLDCDVHFTLDEYALFLHFLFDLAMKNLVSGANFNRRLSALLILECLYERIIFTNGLLDTLCEDFRMNEWFNHENYKQLLNCLDDSYLLCQNIVFGLLEKIPPLLNDKDYAEIMNQTLLRLTVISSNSYLSSSARLQFVCKKRPDLLESILGRINIVCEENLIRINESILNICSDYPIFPVLHSMHSILQLYTDFSNLNLQTINIINKYLVGKIIPNCFQAALLVCPIVHSMSPEGFTPTEWFDQIKHSNIEIRALKRSNISQKLLVGCWRSHESISKIFHYIVENIDHSIIGPSLLRKIEDYLWIQLTECKHRGAFEISAIAFDALCRRLWQIESDKIVFKNEICFPEEMMDKILQALRGGKDIDKLCSTRRSGGLPHLVVGLLCTVPKNKCIPFIENTLNHLLECERLPELLQVHCINVLKAVFSETRLSEKVFSFAEKTFRLCFDGFVRASWPVRNALCQLYAALIRRIFGVSHISQRTFQIYHRCTKSSFDFFTKFPRLYPYLYQRLDAAHGAGAEISIFPIFLLFIHLFPSPSESKYRLSVFIPKLLQFLFVCKSEQLRELLCASLVSISEFEDLKNIFSLILRKEFNKRAWNSFASVLLLILTTISFGKSDGLETLFEDFLCNQDINEIPDYVLQNYLTLLSLSGSTSAQQSAILKCIELMERGDRAPNFYSSARSFGKLLNKNLQFWPNIMSSENSFITDIRFEAYRGIIKDNLTSSNEQVESAVKDFITCSNEYHLEYITLLLIRNYNSIGSSYKKQVLERCENLLNSNTIRKLSLTISTLELMLKLTNFNTNQYYLDILNQAMKDDDLDIRLKCLSICDRYMGRSNNDYVLRMTCLLLQDDESEVREKTAKIVAKYLINKDLELNSSILWALAILKFPDLTNEIMGECGKILLDENDIFETCSKNPFAENFEMPYFEFVQNKIVNL